MGERNPPGREGLLIMQVIKGGALEGPSPLSDPGDHSSMRSITTFSIAATAFRSCGGASPGWLRFIPMRRAAARMSL